MSDSQSIAKALHNAQRALHRLKRFLAREPRGDEMVRAAIIQAFEFTFEATWKLLQKAGTHEGHVIHSPRSALAYGFKRGLFSSESSCLNMLRDRNLTTHTYNGQLAERISDSVRDMYAPILERAVSALKTSVNLGE